MARGLHPEGAVEAPSLLARLDAAPEGPAWLRPLRVEAAAALRASGLPGKRDEPWRFTSVRSVVAPEYGEAAADDAAVDAAQALVEAALGGPDGAPRVLVVNGRLAASEALPRGVRVASIAEALGGGAAAGGASAELAALLGALAPRVHFAALNAARFDDGLVVELGPEAEGALHLVHVAVSGERPVVAYPRVLVRVHGGATATLIESFHHDGRGTHLTNAVTEVALDAGARLEHVRHAEGSPDGLRVEWLAVRLARESAYACRVFALGGGFHRLDLHADLVGEGAEAALEGVYHARDGELVDHHVRVDHRAPRGMSRQVFRGIADGKGEAVFDTIARVHPEGQRSEAHQENRNLLLSDDASLHTKPHLEILADDVKASHGATVGSLDPDQVFYLRARGIEGATAEAVLTFAFVAELAARVPHGPTRARIVRALLARLPGGETLEGLAEEEAP